MNALTRGRIVAFLAAFLAVSALSIVSVAKEKKGTGERLYTSCNIWWEHPERVYSTLFQKGSMLSAGTEITSLEVSSKWIEFTAASGGEFRMEWWGKHRPGVDSRAFADRLFTTKDFAALTSGFTSEEIEAIKAGEIRKGMSKAAVLVSVGPPPEIRTPSTSADTWIYWHDRFRNFSVGFVDGKVSQVGQ